MRERVLFAIHKVWANRCEEICRDVEYGITTGVHTSDRRIVQIARSNSDPRLVAGIFHARPSGHGEWELLNERHFSPPVRVETLPRFYQLLIDNTAPVMWVPEALEQDAIRYGK